MSDERMADLHTKRMDRLAAMVQELRSRNAALQERYDALMEGLGLDPSPECMDEYPAGRLKVEGYGLRGRVERLEHELDEAHAAISALRERYANLRDYAWHINDCDGPNGEPCTCGFDAAMGVGELREG